MIRPSEKIRADIGENVYPAMRVKHAETQALIDGMKARAGKYFTRPKWQRALLWLIGLGETSATTRGIEELQKKADHWLDSINDGERKHLAALASVQKLAKQEQALIDAGRGYIVWQVAAERNN